MKIGFQKNFFENSRKKIVFRFFLHFLRIVIFEIDGPNFWGVSTFFYIFHVLRKKIQKYGDVDIS